MNKQCANCVYISTTGKSVAICLAMSELLENQVLCKGKLYKKIDDTIPRGTDVTQALDELKGPKEQ